MAEERAKRKLSAILSADVKGYSRLMGDDELSTIETLKRYREVITTFVQQYRGRVVDSPGDNVLAEFASVVDGVECAVKIQEELKTKNAELPENRKMEFRIGVNLGDVVEDGERIFGDGVNIAARIEGLAEPGGICISRTAYDHIKNKLKIGYESLGEHSVKNIAEPVRIYRVLMEPEAAGKVIGEKRFLGRISRKTAMATIIGLVIIAGGLIGWNIYLQQSKKIEPASLDKMAYPLPDKPSIAVLPFDNLSGVPEQEYFNDGLTEEIITALSKMPQLFVIARSSTFTYKGKPVKVQQISEELGVRYVLEGSVRRVENRVRITAQLIDAIKGHHIWAERYDKDLKDMFALQDEITMNILTALQVKLTGVDYGYLLSKRTDNLQAYLKYLQALEHKYTLTKEGNALARRLLEEAIAIDPEFTDAYVVLGQTHYMDIFYQSTKSPEESLDRSFELIKKAIDLDDSLSNAHHQLGFLYIRFMRKYDKAIDECERAIALAPNSADAHIWMAVALKFASRHEEALQYCEQAFRLNPIHPRWWFRLVGSIQILLGRYNEAIINCKKALDGAPDDILTHRCLTSAYSWAGRLEEARAQAKEVLRINPEHSLELYAKSLPFKNKADSERIIEGLRMAGLK
jgi:adenylate cyclase